MARARTSRRSDRGYGLIELMIASVILIVAVIGFVGAMREAVNATAVAHRRTEATLLRTGLLEKMTVARRDIVAPLAAAGGWMVESCYDVNALPLGDNPGVTGGAWDPAFACPAGWMYRRIVSAAAVPDPAGNPQRIWTMAVYVERTAQGCTAATRYQSLDCVGADLYLTD
jgi:Tfp pilus assembly protein PilV